MNLKHSLRCFIAKKRFKQLYALLNIGYEEELDGDAIIEAVRQNPKSAKEKYKFTKRLSVELVTIGLYPLQRAIFMWANIDVVQAIYNSYPPALEKQIEWHGKNALHHALQRNIPAEVTSFVFDKFPATKFPAAVQKRDALGKTPLLYACQNGASFEVVSLLLKVWPSAAQERDCRGNVPLHYAHMLDTSSEAVSLLLEAWPDAVRAKNVVGSTPFLAASGWNASIDTMTVILDYWPQAVREKDYDGGTPLYWACRVDASLDAIMLLLEKWPGAIKERYLNSDTPLDVYEENRGLKVDSGEAIEQRETENKRKVLSCVYRLYSDMIDDDLAKKMMDFFIGIEWWNGIFLILDRHPPLKRLMDIENSIFPKFLFVVRQHCKMKTLWRIIGSRLDIIEGV